MAQHLGGKYEGYKYIEGTMKNLINTNVSRAKSSTALYTKDTKKDNYGDWN